MILGTVAYLSPEQVATGAADARSDVYAAGVLLYELLVGEPPYTGDTAISVAYRHVNCDVPPPSAIAGDVPPELDELVCRATRRDPAGRPADAAALLDELRRVAHQLEIPQVDVPVPPPQPSSEAPTVPAEHPTGRRHTLAAAAGMSANGQVGPGPVGPGGTRTLQRPAEPPTRASGPPPHLLARRRSRRIFAGWVAVVVLLAVLVATVAWWLGSGRWTAMPAVVGLPETTAQQLLTEADLVATTTRDDGGGAKAGVVTASDQSTGTRLLRGSRVTLTVSSGRPTVPAIPAGTSRDEAVRILEAAGLDPDIDRADAEYSSSVDEGAVIRTEPGAGTEIDRGSTVRLVLSRGEESDDEDNAQVQVPFVVGEDFDDARDQLADLGLDVERESRSGLGGRFPGGLGNRVRDQVLQQSHGPGSMVDRGTTITLETF